MIGKKNRYIPNWKRTYEIARDIAAIIIVNGHPDHFIFNIRTRLFI